jgi:DNA replication and repair protein RecF
MLRLQQLSLVHFKNYTSRQFDFRERITGICGNNGAGKTNLLDAIHYLCFTRSYFSRQDAPNTLYGQQGFRLEADFLLHDKPEKAVCILRETGRKEFTINGNPYERFSQHIGRYPCVMIAPDDALLVTGASEERRKFIDSVLSQMDAEYLRQLIIYTKVLQQRNSLLRSFAENGNRDDGLLDVLDKQLMDAGNIIFNRRKDFLISFLPFARHLYHDIAGKDENIIFIYDSELIDAGFDELLRINRQKDMFNQRTHSGIHRDDIELRLDDQPFRNSASQGQRKSLLFALKLAEMLVLKNEKGFPPLLLLDDVFEKLDEGRIHNLLVKVCVENEGQVFITDTNRQRLEEHLNQVNSEFEMIVL